ncbi:hypothetical protein FOXG_20553 [Fusarium oxysporum f. sp. lycopersici 4287]|uniref:Secreted protein n=1 Tax=Fusarium oxysporum f. sp. lycopersici (strain 4287 / CBS 123668 / FGSC 9935 / NRRL 34936) TaxID=426428 RepID=A0A0J9VLR6_FUSO4|nr:hypothetical protein FOXG_20553 [Fusarium oxysporum f. sp. lycopersici 4287]KNB11726.1 hypothetical protein FOXG_20553 [Fusarium oxysporum f. sp. lycopersici 4287]
MELPSELLLLLLLASGSTPMAAHMRANWARKAGSERISRACVFANCWRRERNTASCVSRAWALLARREEPCDANCADVRRERSKAARPTPLRDIVEVGNEIAGGVRLVLMLVVEVQDYVNWRGWV